MTAERSQGAAPEIARSPWDAGLLACNAEARAVTGFGYKKTSLQPVDLFLQIASGALTAAQQIKVAVRKSRD